MNRLFTNAHLPLHVINSEIVVEVISTVADLKFLAVPMI